MLVKRFVCITACALALASPLFGGGCGQKGMISASALDVPMRGIIERHDGYVAADAAMSDVERSTYLRSSELMIVLLDNALEAPAPPVAYVPAISDAEWAAAPREARLGYLVGTGYMSRQQANGFLEAERLDKPLGATSADGK